MGSEIWNGQVSRRDLLRDAAILGGGAALAASPASALAKRRTPRMRSQVAVLGGGMAGLAAAHELIERGFGVTVYERKALGGKARSIASGLPATGGRRELPGEHGFRFFPGFYHHVPDTMRRIPFPGNPNGVHDNMVSAPTAVISRVGQEDVTIPFGVTEHTPGAMLKPDVLADLLIGAGKIGATIPPHELAEFVQRLMVFFTSCDDRRYGQWENTSWMEFVRAEGKSEGYRHMLASGLTRALVAAKENVASSRTIGNMAEAFLIANYTNRGSDGDPDRVLNGPTNEVWIDPWVTYLKQRGVKFRVGYTIESLKTGGGKVVAAGVRDRRGQHRRIEADWFICAMPVERAVKLWNREVLALDPHLAAMNELFVDWMNGIQFYLTRNAPLTQGHMAYMDSQWSLSSINQAQFWAGRDLSRDYGDGTVKDILSVDISDWDTKGILFGKTAKECTAEEVAKEAWAQMKASVNDTRPGTLRDEDLHSWYLDPGIKFNTKKGRNRNDDPLLVNTVGSWKDRPTARTKVPNLFVAGDYVQTNIDLATMEGANESGRAAVNALLDASGSKAEPVKMFKLFRPPEFEASKQIDQQRWNAGQRNLLDT